MGIIVSITYFTSDWGKPMLSLCVSEASNDNIVTVCNAILPYGSYFMNNDYYMIGAMLLRHLEARD
jgi:hypothetical protein